MRESRCRTPLVVIGALALALFACGWARAGGAPIPESPASTVPAAPADDAKAAPETPSAQPRAKLAIVPESVLEEAARDREFVTVGTRLTNVTGNDRRFRRYFYTEPTRLLVLESLRAVGTDNERQVMYDFGVTTPGLESSSASLQLRGFDSAPTLRVEWDRARFYREFGPTAGLSTRENLSALARVRLRGKTWLDVTYTGRTVDSAAGSLRPVAFHTDELRAATSWSAGDATLAASLSVSRYVDGSSAFTPGGNWLRANRVTTRAAVSAASATRSDLQWRVGASYRSSVYPALGGQRAVSYSSGAGLQYRAGGHLLLTAGIGYIAVPRTITTNTYNPESATFRTTGTYTGLRHLRTTFGYERRVGRRYAVRPDLTTPEGFIENQTVDRLWLTGRLRNKSQFTVDFALRYRRLSGSVTSYLGNMTTIVPVLLYPEQTTAQIEAGYPTDAGALSASLTVGRYRNPDRGTVVGSVGFTGLWTRTWGGKWTGLLQYDHARYVSSNPLGTPVDIDLGGWTASLSYSLRKASVTGSLGYYRTIGTFAALTQDARLTCAYRASDSLSLNLTWSHQRENGTGVLAYRGSTVLLSGAYEF